jgi:hypothetical protein
MPRAAPPSAHAGYVLDGGRMTTLATCLGEVGRRIVGRADAVASLADLDELLVDLAARRGGGARIDIASADVARRALGYPETVRWLTGELRDCPPNTLIRTAWALRAALRGTGPTLFDVFLARLRARPGVAVVLSDAAAPLRDPGG